jgi:pimeloyl-ACP methyl ester carboxylesterase
VAGRPRNFPDRDGVVDIGAGRELGFAEWGERDGRVVLWFHGTPGAARQVPPDAPDVARQHGVRLIGIERPGTGSSTKHRHGSILDWAVDVERFADRAQVDDFGVVGLSGGGPYVLACAAHFHERMVAGAVLGGLGPTRGPEAAPGLPRLLPPFEPLLSAVSAPMAEAFSLVLRPLATVAASPMFDLYANVISPECDRPVLRRPDMKEAFLYDITTAARKGVRASVYDMVLFGRDWGFSLADLDVPIRFWHGDADRIVPLSHGVHQAALVPDSELTVVPGGGHFSGYETVDEVFDVLMALWADRVGNDAGDAAVR